MTRRETDVCEREDTLVENSRAGGLLRTTRSSASVSVVPRKRCAELKKSLDGRKFSSILKSLRVCRWQQKYLESIYGLFLGNSSPFPFSSFVCQRVANVRESQSSHTPLLLICGWLSWEPGYLVLLVVSVAPRRCLNGNCKTSNR